MGTRDINEGIAASYDSRPWTQTYPDATAAVVVQLLAKPYGGSGAMGDVLDLGCGTGALLLQAGEKFTGRLVGTDISAASCERARDALRPYGERAEIHHADILDLSPERLGKFDLIYCTGVMHVVPPAVREHIVELIGQCLKPGGAALLSYYTGLRAAVRAHMAKTVRAAATGGSDTAEQTRKGRDAVDQLRPALGRQSHFTLPIRAAFGHFDGSDDEFFFAENLNGGFEPISTAELHRALSPAGIHFATYLNYSGFKPAYDGDARAVMADRFDLTAGAYQYALFVKPAAEWTAPQREVPAADAYPAIAGATRPKMRPRRLLRRLFWLIFRV